MKAIILISSIFYILGLKIGNNINLSIDSTSVKKVIPNTIPGKSQVSTFEFNNKNDLIEADSLKTNQNANKFKNVSE